MMLNDPHDHLEDIEKQFQIYISDWKENKAGSLRSLYGPPGAGKTWLLKRWQQKWRGVYFDLSENASTPDEYIRRAQERLAQESGRHILYLDNVPVALDERLQVFQNEILWDEFNNGSLVIQCQTHPNQTCWGGALPHPLPQDIPGLTQAGMMTIHQKQDCSGSLSATEKLLFSCDEILPGLVKAWCQGMRDRKLGQTVLRDYLHDWWSRFETHIPNSFSMALYPYAMLTCRNLGDMSEFLALLTPAQKDDLTRQGVRFDERGLKLTLKLKRLQWMRSDNSWYPPVAAALKTWFSLREPQLYQDLTS